MARIKTIQCPQCSGIHPQKIAEGEYKCTYCDAIFHIEEKKQPNIQDIFKSLSGNKNVQHNIDPAQLVRAGRIVKVVVAAVVISIIAGVAIPLIATFNSTSTTTVNGVAASPGWQAPSVDSRKYFDGSKGPVMWRMMKESGERLDSARYTLNIVQLSNRKTLATKRWEKTITWRDGFDFGKNYYDRVFSTGDTVWVTSAERIVTGYNMYTGKRICSVDQLQDAVKQFEAGISEVSEIYNKPGMEIKTDDGFTYTYFPGKKFIIEKDKFSTYQYNNKSRKTYYTLSEGARPSLWKVRMDVAAFENTGSMSGHMLGYYKSDKSYLKRAYGFESLDSVTTTTVFFKGSILWFNDESVVIFYRGSLAKKAAAYIECIDDKGTVKWKTSLDEIKGLTEAYKNEQYVQYFTGKKEIMVLHQAAHTIAAGIDIATGKIKWQWYEE